MDDELRLHTMDKSAQEKVNKSRERSDKISALMGQYMLKGYRMLGSACDVCGNVLLKYRDQDDYCVACKEVDVDTQSVTQDSCQMGIRSQVQQCKPSTKSEASKLFCDPTRGKKTPVERTVQCSEEFTHTSQDAICAAVSAVNEKIVWACEALGTSHSTGECIQLCELLKSCAETLKALEGLKHFNG